MLLELDKHPLNVIAYDGIQLGALQEMKQLLIAPGQRADVLVQAGGPGTYELNAMPFNQSHPSPTAPLARVVVAGEPLPMKLPAALPKFDLGDGVQVHERGVSPCRPRPSASCPSPRGSSCGSAS